MPDIILPNLGMEIPDVGLDSDTWGDILNGNLEILDNAVTLGRLTKTLGAVDVTLTDAEAAKGVIDLTGTLTANVNVIVPATPVRLYLVRNGTTGAFSVTVKTPLGAGVTIAQGYRALVCSNETNVEQGVLQIAGDSLGGGRATLKIRSTDGVGGGGRTIYVGFEGTSNDTGPVQTEFGFIGAAKENATQGNTQGYLVGAVNTGSGLAEAFRVTSGRNFLVGTPLNTIGARMTSNVVVNSAPAISAWNADTTGDNLFHVLNTEAGGTQRGSIDYNRAGGLVRYNTTSDGTLKNIKNPADLDQSVALIMSIPIDEWAWKHDENQWSQIGPIAQKLHEVFPGAVSVGGEYEAAVPATYDEEGNELTPETTETRYRPWAVDKTAPVWHLVATCQKQQQIIQAQQAQIESILTRLAALEQE